MVEQLLAEDRNGSFLPEPMTAPSPTRESDGIDRITVSWTPLGEGGMGTVYRAIDTRLDRTVALKFKPPQILRESANRGRFWREATSVASIDHPNVCPVYGMEEDGAFLFIAMAYLDGLPLDRRIASSRVSTDEAERSKYTKHLRMQGNMDARYERERLGAAAGVTGLISQELLLKNEYLAAENRILRARLPARLRLSDPERSTLAEIGKRLGRKTLAACVAKTGKFPLTALLSGSKWNCLPPSVRCIYRT